jgi:hypothetical protein
MPAWKDMTPEQREERVAALKAGRLAAKGRPSPERFTVDKSDPLNVRRAGDTMTPERMDAAADGMEDTSQRYAARAVASNMRREAAKAEAAKAEAGAPVMVTLSAEEIADIRQKAIDELAKEKKKELIAAELVKQRRLVAESMGMPVEPEPEEPQEYSFMPQLAEFAPHLRIDGRYYFHGVTYHGLNKNQYDTLRSMEAQTWTHQATIDGKRQNYYNANSRLWQTAGGGVATGATRHVI